jgi:uncharacterized protein YkwD
MQRWKGDPEAAKMALDPGWDGVGIATVRADDGTLVLAALFVQTIEPKTDLRAFERRIESMVNDVRRDAGLPALAHSSALADVARAHSVDMAQNHYMGHDDLQGHGPDWRVRQRGIRYRKVAENVAQNQGWEDPARRAVEGWLESPGHRHNIMDPDVRQAGVGVALDPESGTYYFTQLFLEAAAGSRRSH